MSLPRYVTEKFSRFTQADSFIQAFHPIHIFISAIGGNQIIFHEDGSTNYPLTITSSAWCMMIAIVFAMDMVDRFSANSEKLYLNSYSTYDFVIALRNICVSICNCINVLSHAYNVYTYQMKLVYKTKEQDEILRKAEVSLDWSRLKGNFVKIIILICAVQTCNMIVLMFYGHYLFYFIQNFNYLGVTVLAYYSHIHMMTTAFEKLNMKLATIKEASERQNTPSTLLVESLALAHLSLCKQVREFNETFGLQLLTTVLNIYIYITCAVYIFFAGYDNIEVIRLIYARYYAFIVLVALLFIIVETCKSNVHEICKTMPIVVDIMNLDEVDDELTETLLHFMLQLSSLDIRHTAFGFFKLDRSLYYNIVISTYTYVIVLLQTNDAHKAIIETRRSRNTNYTVATY